MSKLTNHKETKHKELTALLDEIYYSHDGADNPDTGLEVAEKALFSWFEALNTDKELFYEFEELVNTCIAESRRIGFVTGYAHAVKIMLACYQMGGER